MDRKTFIKTSCIACSSIGFLSTVLESCTSVKYASGNMNKDGLLINLNQFALQNGKQRAYVIVRHDDLKFPICVYRINDSEYSALWMQCTHQGAELQVAGDQLTCPAHGSGFDKYGKVIQSPAASNLRSFPITITGDQLFIDLRKQA